MYTIKRHLTLLLLSASFALGGCCAFKEGAWAPLPSCKHADEYQQEKRKREREKQQTLNGTDSIDGTTESDKQIPRTDTTDGQWR